MNSCTANVATRYPNGQHSISLIENQHINSAIFIIRVIISMVAVSISSVPEDVLGSIIEYLLIEETAKCILICKEWQITATFTLHWMYQQNIFQSITGRTYLQPPRRTAGRVVNLRVGNLLSQQQQQQQQQPILNKSKPRNKNKTNHAPPVAPSSPAISMHQLPTPISLISVQIGSQQLNFDEPERQIHINQKKTTMKKKKTKTKKKRNKNNSNYALRPPLAQKSTNIQQSKLLDSQPHSSLFGAPSVINGSSNGNGNIGGARVVRIIAPKTIFEDYNDDVLNTKDMEHVAKTPPGKSRGRRHVPTRRQRSSKLNQTNQSITSKAKIHTLDVENEGRPYQYIDSKTKVQGSILSALGGKKLQTYYIQQHQPKTYIKRGFKKATQQTGTTSFGSSRNHSGNSRGSIFHY